MSKTNSRSKQRKGNSNDENRDTAFNTVPESSFNDKRQKNKQSKRGSNPKFKSGCGPTGRGRNPIEIWNKHADLTEAAGSLAYAQSLGQPLDWDSAGGTITNNTTAFALPGIASLGLCLTYGTANDEGSALNIAARNIYTFVRHLNSGHTNYDAANLMQYLIAVDQCYAMYSWLIRIYGTLLNYKVLNRYTPDDLLTAQGVDPSSFRSNMAQFRFAIDAWAVRLQSFLVPSTIDVFKRHYDMFSNYYLDSENLQIAQVYMFKPDKLFYWDDAAVTIDTHFKTALDMVPDLTISSVNSSHVGTVSTTANKALLTFSQLATIMDNMLQSIAVTEDFNIMSGDILKAYGAGNTWTVPMVASNYIAEPVFNWEMLVQIHNAHIFPLYNLIFKTGVSDATLQAWVDEFNARVYRPTEVVNSLTQTSFLTMDCFSIQNAAGNAYIDGASLLDVPFTQPTAQDNMEATRLKALAGSIVTLDSRLTNTTSVALPATKLRSVGTEVITSFEVYTRTFAHASVRGDYVYTGLDVVRIAQLTSNPAASIQRTVQFTLFPVYYNIATRTSWTIAAPATDDVFTFDASDPTSTGVISNIPLGTGVPIVGELDHSTVVSGVSVDNLHIAAILSAFNIPASAFKA